MSSNKIPDDEEIRGFIHLTFGGMFVDGIDTNDINGAIEDFKIFISPYISQSIPDKLSVQNNG
jgi:hypothetical protein